MSFGGGGSKKCGKIVTYYLNGPLWKTYLKCVWYSVAKDLSVKNKIIKDYKHFLKYIHYNTT